MAPWPPLATPLVSHPTSAARCACNYAAPIVSGLRHYLSKLFDSLVGIIGIQYDVDYVEVIGD